MLQVIKKEGKQVEAYEVGRDLAAIRKLVDAGKVKDCGDGTWEVFSKEAVHGKGEVCREGDFIKLDSDGDPYPNSREFFLQNHRHLEGQLYEQKPVPLTAWEVGEPDDGLLRFLMEKKGLVINEESQEKYFTAPLWGSLLSASKDAVLVLYKVTKDEEGQLLDVDFNFVTRKVFEESYRVLGKGISFA